MSLFIKKIPLIYMPLSQIRRGLPQPGGMASERQTFDFATYTACLQRKILTFFIT